MENENIGGQIGAVLNGIASLQLSGIIDAANVAKANTILGKFLDKVSVCVDKMELCPDDEQTPPPPPPTPPTEQPKAFVGFCLNIYSETTEGGEFKVVVDGEEFIVLGNPAMSGISMHMQMKDKLSGHPKFDVESFYENGSPTNYGYVLREKQNNDMLAKHVTVSVTGLSYGNITVNGYVSDMLTGTGNFILSN